ncbi:MAG: TolC family protein [Phycisphaerae bacterium]|jgi:outer membrane protein TolC
MQHQELRLIIVLIACSSFTMLGGCRTAVDQTDREVAAVIAERQRAALDIQVPVRISSEDDSFERPPRSAFDSTPNPRPAGVPAAFEQPAEPPATTDAPEIVTTAPPSTMTGAANSRSGMLPPAITDPVSDDPPVIFTLTDALAYAQQHRRALQRAEEQLYVAALALTLERHLWTPIFSSNLRTVYGNFGEIQHFDQAMRFVADLSVSQRLPYGGEFTAQAVSTLIRDVKKTITSAEGSTIEVGLNVPFLRNAGHVAQEELIQLERELTYAVRAYERFRRTQLVLVTEAYFDLLRAKQDMVTSEMSLSRRGQIFQRAREFEKRELGSLLETQRAEQDYLFAENELESVRESFRAQADQFKLLIGMSVDQPLGRDQLEDIQAIEGRIAGGEFPLLQRSAAVEQDALAQQVAIDYRLDLLSEHDRIDDARRGVAVAENAMLPDLDLNTTVAWETDPTHYRLGDFSFERTTWRSELVLELPLERTRERHQYRAALLDVRQAERDYQDALESIRAEVRSAVNNLRLEDRSVEIQQRNLAVADNRVEYARIRYDDGEIEVRELLDAEADWTSVSNALSRAKTSRWKALLRFRLSTGTLRIHEDGEQEVAPVITGP